MLDSLFFWISKSVSDESAISTSVSLGSKCILPEIISGRHQTYAFKVADDVAEENVPDIGKCRLALAKLRSSDLKRSRGVKKYMLHCIAFLCWIEVLMIWFNGTDPFVPTELKLRRMQKYVKSIKNFHFTDSKKIRDISEFTQKGLLLLIR